MAKNKLVAVLVVAKRSVDSSYTVRVVIIIYQATQIKGSDPISTATKTLKESPSFHSINQEKHIQVFQEFPYDKFILLNRKNTPYKPQGEADIKKHHDDSEYEIQDGQNHP